MATTTINIGYGPFLTEILIISHLLSGFIGMTLWKTKGGNPSRGLLFGALLGILGVIILAFAEPRQKELARVARSQELVSCLHYGELIKRQAHVCRYCGRDVAAAAISAT